MLINRLLFVVTSILVLGACAFPHKKSQKQGVDNSPVNQSWILGAPPHGDDQVAQHAPTVLVQNPHTVESRLERLEDDMAKIKLDLAQLVPLSHGTKTMAHAPKMTKRTSTNQKTGVRFGIHGSKTRIVFDLPHASKFKTDLDNQERFLLVDFQGTNLNLHNGLGKGLVSSYEIDTDTNGVTRVIVILNADTQIIAQEALNPSGKSGHRVFIDLVRN